MHQPTCTTTGCDRPSFATGLCQLCYARQWRARTAVEPCAVEDCTTGAFSLGLCGKHYKRQHRYGDPLGGPAPRPPKPEPVRAAPRPLSTTYGAVHARLRKQRGSSTDQPCAHCGQPAQGWAYDHTDPNPLTEWLPTKRKRGKTVTYSADLQRYLPLCDPCHLKFDAPYNGSNLQAYNQQRAAASIKIDLSNV